MDWKVRNGVFHQELAFHFLCVYPRRALAKSPCGTPGEEPTIQDPSLTMLFLWTIKILRTSLSTQNEKNNFSG